MGSGMLPIGAYTTLEHEYILILRKGNSRRNFKSEQEKINIRASAFFWEERNLWFSDIWFDVKGTKQTLLNDSLRTRSAAYPFEIPYRLINMYSVKGDVVLDPYLGTGTTSVAAVASGRNSIGVEIVQAFKETIEHRIRSAIDSSKYIVNRRLELHKNFINDRIATGKKFKYFNNNYNSPVVSKQEVDIIFQLPTKLEFKDDKFIFEYS
jgi:DNA modification methylase